MHSCTHTLISHNITLADMRACTPIHPLARWDALPHALLPGRPPTRPPARPPARMYWHARVSWQGVDKPSGDGIAPAGTDKADGTDQAAHSLNAEGTCARACGLRACARTNLGRLVSPG